MQIISPQCADFLFVRCLVITVFLFKIKSYLRRDFGHQKNVIIISHTHKNHSRESNEIYFAHLVHKLVITVMFYKSYIHDICRELFVKNMIIIISQNTISPRVDSFRPYYTLVSKHNAVGTRAWREVEIFESGISSGRRRRNGFSSFLVRLSRGLASRLGRWLSVVHKEYQAPVM